MKTIGNHRTERVGGTKAHKRREVNTEPEEMERSEIEGHTLT